jgi:hypothetical protein
MKTREANTLTGKKIQIRGLDRSTIASQVFGTQVIRKKQDHIGERIGSQSSPPKKDCHQEKYNGSHLELFGLFMIRYPRNNLQCGLSS